MFEDHDQNNNSEQKKSNRKKDQRRSMPTYVPSSAHTQLQNLCNLFPYPPSAPPPTRPLSMSLIDMERYSQDAYDRYGLENFRFPRKPVGSGLSRRSSTNSTIQTPITTTTTTTANINMNDIDGAGAGAGSPLSPPSLSPSSSLSSPSSPLSSRMSTSFEHKRQPSTISTISGHRHMRTLSGSTVSSSGSGHGSLNIDHELANKYSGMGILHSGDNGNSTKVPWQLGVHTIVV